MDNEGKEESKKVFTIRGLDPELYEKFTQTAKSLGVSVGELMNEAMRTILTLIIVSREAGEKAGKELGKATASMVSAPLKVIKAFIEGFKDFEVVTSIGELSISRADLEGVEKPVLFVNIRKLVFEDDVDWDLINSKVKGVKLVDEVVIPKNIPKLLFAKKCLMVKKLVSQKE